MTLTCSTACSHAEKHGWMRLCSASTTASKSTISFVMTIRNGVNSLWKAPSTGSIRCSMKPPRLHHPLLLKKRRPALPIPLLLMIQKQPRPCSCKNLPAIPTNKKASHGRKRHSSKRPLNCLLRKRQKNPQAAQKLLLHKTKKPPLSSSLHQKQRHIATKLLQPRTNNHLSLSSRLKRDLQT